MRRSIESHFTSSTPDGDGNSSACEQRFHFDIDMRTPFLAWSDGPVDTSAA
jgi:hypothetical protein